MKNTVTLPFQDKHFDTLEKVLGFHEDSLDLIVRCFDKQLRHYILPKIGRPWCMNESFLYTKQDLQEGSFPVEYMIIPQSCRHLAVSNRFPDDNQYVMIDVDYKLSNGSHVRCHLILSVDLEISMTEFCYKYGHLMARKNMVRKYTHPEEFQESKEEEPYVDTNETVTESNNDWINIEIPF